MIPEIVNAVTTLGFPIVCAAAMFYLCNKTIAENTKAINELQKSISNLFVKIDAEKEGDK